MIVLDASVLIAFLDREDAHHARSMALLRSCAEETLAASVLTVSEVLVGPARLGRAPEALEAVRGLGVRTLSVTEPLQLAELRARTGLRLPDCCVLLAAAVHGASVATFDAAQAAAALREGLRVAPPAG